ncbi:MAG: PAS domain-containing protein [Candidatus Omnitrophica bacterium]|nr:PAS domain-containing protein [Candidatus Omnitrophota bacterium]
MSQPSDLPSQLRATLGKMELALGAIAEAIVWTDEAGRVQWANAPFSRLVGKRNVEVLGAPLIGLLPLERGGQALTPEAHPMNLVLTTAPIASGEYEFRAPRKRLLLELTATHTMLETGAIVVVVIRDITEHKRTQETLRKETKEKEKLETMSQVMLGREERILELKQEVNALLKGLNKPQKYV